MCDITHVRNLKKVLICLEDQLIATIEKCHMIDSYVWKDSFMCVTLLIHV